MSTAVKHCIVCVKLTMKQDRNYTRTNKVALNSTSGFVLLVECANTHDFTELRLESMDEEGCRGIVRREVVDDKENEEAGEGTAGQAGRYIDNIENV